MTLNSDQRGRTAEANAQKFLENKGYETFATRYKTPYGEIDLLMTTQQTLVAVEVKYRKTFIQAAESILPRQKLRIQNALSYFLEKHPSFIHQYPFIRFDVILLCSLKAPIHFIDAWQVEEY